MVEMSRKLAEYLKNSQTLDDYCQQEFGKGITVAVEYANTNEVPDINSVPYLMFYNAGKVEGLANRLNIPAILLLVYQVKQQAKIITLLPTVRFTS